MSKLFSDFLLEMETYKTKEEVYSATQKWDKLPDNKKASEAKNILKCAEKIGVRVHNQDILHYDLKMNKGKQTDKENDKKEVVFSKQKANKIKDSLLSMFKMGYPHIEVKSYGVDFENMMGTVETKDNWYEVKIGNDGKFKDSWIISPIK